MEDGPRQPDTTERFLRASIVDELITLLQDNRIDEALAMLYAEASRDQTEIQEDLILALCSTDRAPLVRRFIRRHTDGFRACEAWLCFITTMQLADDEDLAALGASIGGIESSALRLYVLDTIHDFLGHNHRRFDLVCRALTWPDDRAYAAQITSMMLGIAKG